MAAAAATSTTTAATPATTAAATTASSGKHGVIYDEADLAAEVFDIVDGSLFQEWDAVRVHQELDTVNV